MLKSLSRGLDILEYLSRQHNNASVTEIAAAFGIDKSTASRIMTTLVEHGLVFRSEETGGYRLGIGMLMYTYHVMSDNMIMSVAHPILQQLTETTGETAHLGAMHNGRLYVIDHIKSERNRYMKDPTIPGMQEPLHCTAVGKAVLGFMPPAEVRALLDGMELKRYTDCTVTDMDALMGQLADVRREGYALDREELRPGVFCMAAPVFDRYGFVSHSIGLTGTYDFGLYPERFEHNLSRLKEAARELSRQYAEKMDKQ